MPTGAKPAIGPFVLIVSLFFLWGAANNLNDVLIAQFKTAFALTDLQSGLVQSAFYLGYFLLALPAGLFMRRFGYKAAVVFGLVLFGAGALLFYPAAAIRDYGWFLAALFVIASGLSFLETSANPLMTVLGDPAQAERRLNFAQSFNPLGSIAGVWVGREFILSDAAPHAVETVKVPYVILGLVVLGWGLLIARTRFPEAATQRSESGSSALAGIGELLRKGRYLCGVAAQFFYVGAQVGVWSFTIRYAGAEAHLGAKSAAAWLIAALIAFTAGRFAGTALMARIPAARLMGLYAAINVALSLVAVITGGFMGLVALSATSFFMSIMYPSIFAISVRGLGPLTKTASSFLVMSIVGGAVLTALMGRISDLSAIRYAMIVPALSFAVVGAFALWAGRAPASVPV